jgi:acyl-CoA thioester hydrolase
MWYTSRFDDASSQLLSLFGLTSSYFRSHNRFMATMQQETTFNRELSAGDPIEIRSRMLETRESALRVYHQMLHTETHETVAVSTLTEAHVDGATRKPCPLPLEMQRWSPRDGTDISISPLTLELTLPGQW